MAVVHAASVLSSFPFRAAVVALCVLLLPLLPSPRAPAAGEGEGGGGQAFLDKVWELLHLLLVGIAVSYGLFSRRNDGGAPVGGGDKDAAAATEKPDARYVSRMLQGELVFDDDGDDGLPESPVGGRGARSWSALHHPEEPVVLMATDGGGRNHAAAQQAPLSLPVRTLRQQDSGTAEYGNAEPRPRPHKTQDTVLPSPIPWRSRSGRFDAPTTTGSPSPSPKRLSPASSMSNETLAKASEEQATIPKRRSTYKSSAPPAPPPPPPPFLVHGYHPVAERRTTAAKSFKEELQDHSTRGRGDPDHYSNSFSSSSTYTNSSPANPRSSFDGSSSSSSTSVGKSVRTVRPREGIQPQIQEVSDEDEAGDAPDNLHGSEEPYGYNAYQSIPRFQYERASNDPILGRVTVSSDETESSDEDGVSAYSTKTNSPRESSTPEVDENEVDKKAEEFIAKFRESIRLQRIESIKKSTGPRGVKHGK